MVQNRQPDEASKEPQVSPQGMSASLQSASSNQLQRVLVDFTDQNLAEVPVADSDQPQQQYRAPYALNNANRVEQSSIQPVFGYLIEEGDAFMNEFLNNEEQADISRRQEVFDAIAQNFDCSLGKSESRRERQEKGLKDINLTYGEIEFKTLSQIIKWIQITQKDRDPECWHNAFNNPGGTFVDLGHGTGKGILCGTLMHKFDKCWGIEILDSLQSISLNLKDVYNDYVQNADSVEYERVFGWAKSEAPTFEPVHGDMFEHEWHNADFLFVNSTCFSSSLMQLIYEKSKKCKKGSWFATLSKRLPYADMVDPDEPDDPNLHWEFILAVKLQMSWGKATINLQRKRTHPVQEKPKQN